MDFQFKGHTRMITEGQTRDRKSIFYSTLVLFPNDHRDSEVCTTQVEQVGAGVSRSFWTLPATLEVSLELLPST